MTDLKRTAYHEAGHSVAHLRLGVLQAMTTIKAGAGTLGHVTAEGKEHVWSEEDAEKQVLCYCAGYAALMAAGYSQDAAMLGTEDDFENASDLIAAWSLSGTLDEWRARSVELMNRPENIRAVEAVARALMDHESLDDGYIDLLVDLVDGNISKQEWLQAISWQYPSMRDAKHE